MTNKFKKGTLLSYSEYQHTGMGFVVCVTGKSKTSGCFKGIVVRSGSSAPWEVGYKAKEWSKCESLWDVVEIPDSLVTNSK